MSEYWPRAVLHVDMDAFYASVEQLDNPELRGKPVIVGGAAERRGVVSAASYEARKFGVHSAMPTSKAMRLCPSAIFVPVRMDRYCEMSGRIHEIFFHYTPDVQSISVDEAFLDVTGCQRLFGQPRKIARLIKDEIKKETGLTASVGAAPNCFVAKIASDLDKPDGLVVIPADEVLRRLAPLPVNSIWGVGRVTAARMEKMGIATIADLRLWPVDTLTENFGAAAGPHLYNLARGIDERIVHEGDPEKSVSNETTFSEDVVHLKELEKALLALSDKVAGRLRAKNLSGRTVQLKVKYSDFTTVTRRITLPQRMCVGKEIYEHSRALLRERTEAGSRAVRLIGVGVSGFEDRGESQASLFAPQAEDTKDEDVERATDRIRNKLGNGAIIRGTLLDDPEDKKEG